MKWPKLAFKSPQEKKLQVHFLPDGFFFTKAIACPPKLSQKELESFVSTSLESISPFPLEQLLWGFGMHKHGENSEVLIYAALKERLNYGHEVFLEAGHVLPSFAIGYFLAIPGITFFIHQNECSLFEFSGSEKKLLATQKVSETEDIAAVYRQMLAKHGFQEAQVHLIELKGLEFDYQNLTVVYTLSSKDLGSSTRKGQIPLSWLWNADVRDKEFLKKEKQSRKVEQYFRQGMRAAAYGMLLIFLLEAGLIFGKFRLWINNHTKEKLQPKAAAIESKDFLVKKIQHTVEQEIRPFELLGILNRYRPDSVYFSSAIVDNLHNVTIEGIAQAASDVEAYRKALQDSRYFESITIGNIITGNKGARFTLICDFKENNKSQLVALENR